MPRRKVIIELDIDAKAPVEEVVDVIGANLEYGTSREAFDLALDGALGEGKVVDFKVKPGRAK